MMLKPFSLLIFLVILPAVLCAESLFKIDFTEAPDGNAKPWLNLSNFALQNDAKSMRGLLIRDGNLVIELGPNRLGGLALRRDLPEAKRVKVVWAVNRFPKGANWDKGNKREAAMFIVVFGKQLQESDAILLPKVPYFLGVFLGEKEKPNHWYLGNYYTKAGAFTCSPCRTKPGVLVTTELELPQNFKARFHKDMPPVIGFGFEFDTRNTTSDSEMRVQSVEFFDD